MAQTAQPLTQITTANRVLCQGVTYSICKLCYQVIGNSQDESALSGMERFHRCKIAEQGQ
jgi:hypothetical protein